MAIQVVLTETQHDRALQEAYRRQGYNEANGIRGKNKAPSSGGKALELHRIGCIGELAVAVYLGLEDCVFQEVSPVPGSADLPGGIDVKTRPKHSYDLLVPIRYQPDHRYVLVTYEKTINIAGWIWGSEVTELGQIKQLIKGRPCWVVEQSKLRSIESLELEL